MKKWSMLILSALLLMPLGAQAEDLPELLGAVSEGLRQGLSEGLDQAAHAAGDLTLSLDAGDTRIEEGHTLPLTVTAVNPYPEAADVEFTLSLPARLSCAQPLTWRAELPGASSDPVTGEIVPAVLTFTRDVTLLPGGGSEQAALQAEMDLGTRFYRAKATLDLCVPVISARASADGTQGRLVQAGDAFEYRIDVANEGTAPKDVSFEMILPDCVSPAGALPLGFALKGQTVSGVVRAQAASSNVLRIPVTVDPDALEGEKDALRLLAPVLTVDKKRVSVPMLQAVGPMISATLTPERDALEEGRMMDLTITLVNTGLAPADVELSCLLPEGLSAAPTDAQRTATAGEASETTAALPPHSDVPPGAAGEAIPASAPAAHTRAQDGALLFAVHMDAAAQTDSGVAASTKEITLRVRADMPMEDMGERLLGTALAWRVDEGDTQLSEAAVLRVYRSGFLGMTSSEWNGILLAALLMLVTVCCLYSAVRSDSKQDDYCFE